MIINYFNNNDDNDDDDDNMMTIYTIYDILSPALEGVRGIEALFYLTPYINQTF